MELPWDSRGTFMRFSGGYSVPMGLPWGFNGTSIVPMRLHSITVRVRMGLPIYISIVLAWGIVLIVLPWDAHGTYMVLPWDFHGILVSSWDFSGTSMGLPWDSHQT